MLCVTLIIAVAATVHENKTRLFIIIASNQRGAFYRAETIFTSPRRKTFPRLYTLTAHAQRENNEEAAFRVSLLPSIINLQIMNQTK